MIEDESTMAWMLDPEDLRGLNWSKSIVRYGR